MTIKLTATEAKARILSLLDAVEAGEEVEITRHGRTVARLVAVPGPNASEAAWRGRDTRLPGEDLFTHRGVLGLDEHRSPRQPCCPWWSAERQSCQRNRRRGRSARPTSWPSREISPGSSWPGSRDTTHYGGDPVSSWLQRLSAQVAHHPGHADDRADGGQPSQLVFRATPPTPHLRHRDRAWLVARHQGRAAPAASTPHRVAVW